MRRRALLSVTRYQAIQAWAGWYLASSVRPLLIRINSARPRQPGSLVSLSTCSLCWWPTTLTSHHLSARQLRRLFETEDLTVAARNLDALALRPCVMLEAGQVGAVLCEVVEVERAESVGHVGVVGVDRVPDQR